MFSVSLVVAGTFLMIYSVVIFFAIEFIIINKQRRVRNYIILLLIFIIGFLLYNEFLLPVLLYPVVMSFSVTLIFALSIRKPRSLIEQIALKIKKDIPEEGLRYCRRVTWAWAIFMFINTIVSAYTVFLGDRYLWAVYNGVISYVLIGLFFLIEYLIRRKVIRGLSMNAPS